MPLFQIGYRRYEGQRTSHALRWWPITRTGIAIAWRSKLLRYLVYASFLPILYFGWVFIIIGRITDPDTDPSGVWFEVARELLGRQLFTQLTEDPTTVRSAVWAGVFASFGTFWQLLNAGLVAAIAGPALVARDMSSRAFLIYFARPVSRLDYVVGKAGVLVGLLGAVTLLPSFTLYAVSILFSPSIDTIVQTAPVIPNIVLASLGTIVPASLIVLTLSSLTRHPRFAAAAWVVVCLFGMITHGILQQTRGLRDAGWTFLLSIPHSVRTLQLGLYDVEGRVGNLALDRDMRQLVSELMTSDSAILAAAWLLLLSGACAFILLRRVDSPTRI
jgi:ABC-type transport system involved in multi-copper enzyme maturation permease subunit